MQQKYVCLFVLSPPGLTAQWIFSCIFVSQLSVATRNTETKIQGKILCALTEQLSSMHFSCKVNQPQLG